MSALVAEGLRNIDIAERLGTNENMIKNYLRVVYDKLGFDNRLQLALWWIKNTEAPDK